MSALPSPGSAVGRGARASRYRTTRQWIRRADRLVAAFRDGDESSPTLRDRVEALRNKRDTLATKLVACEQHRRRRLPDGERELAVAERELREAWRTAIRSLDRTG